VFWVITLFWLSNGMVTNLPWKPNLFNILVLSQERQNDSQKEIVLESSMGHNAKSSSSSQTSISVLFHKSKGVERGCVFWIITLFWLSNGMVTNLLTLWCYHKRGWMIHRRKYRKKNGCKSTKDFSGQSACESNSIGTGTPLRVSRQLVQRYKQKS